MTVATTNNRISYTGDGSSTVFAFPYKFITAADLKVYLAGALQVSGYTVGTPTDSGANVTFSSAPAAGAAIVLLSDPARTQSTSLPTTGPFPAKSVETMVDKLTLLVQRLFDLTTRSLTLADGDSSSASTNLPTPRALQLIGWNAAGNGLQNYDSSALAGAISVATWKTQRFSGTGAQTVYTLSSDPGVSSNCDVSISGVTQVADVDYTVLGTTLTFTTAPPAGTNNIAVRYGSAASASTSVPLTSSTGSAQLPSGTTAQRDSSPSVGYLRYNTTTGGFEGYGASGWGQVGGGAQANGVLYENSTTITSDYTLTAGKNAMMVGPLTIATGVKLTIPSGQRLVIL